MTQEEADILVLKNAFSNIVSALREARLTESERLFIQASVEVVRKELFPIRMVKPENTSGE